MFRLKGELLDIKALVELFPVIIEHKGDHHYLRLSSLGETLDDKAALEAAENEFERMNAIASLRHSNHRPVSIDGITRKDPATGELITALSAKCLIEARSRASITPRLIKDGVEIVETTPKPTFGETMLRLTSKNAALAGALQHFGKEGDTFPGLYKVWEYIKKGNGGKKGIIAKGWASKYEIGRFTGTAQEHRHGVKPSNMTAPEMTLQEAQAVIRKLLDAWVIELGR